MDRPKAPRRTRRARLIEEVPVKEEGRHGRGKAAAQSGASDQSYLLNPISHRVLVEKAKSAPKMENGKISPSSRIIIQGTVVVLEKALKRLADR